MAIAIWKPGRRIFSSAAILMLLLAAAHTAGNLAGGPLEPREEKLFADMAALRTPLGMGMSPSMKDIYFYLGWTASITVGALGLINLSLAAISETPDRVLRCVSWVNAVWVGAFLILSWVYRIPPPLISLVVIETVVVASLLKRSPNT